MMFPIPRGVPPPARRPGRRLLHVTTRSLDRRGDVRVGLGALPPGLLLLPGLGAVAFGLLLLLGLLLLRLGAVVGVLGPGEVLGDVGERLGGAGQLPGPF